MAACAEERSGFVDAALGMTHDGYVRAEEGRGVSGGKASGRYRGLFRLGEASGFGVMPRVASVRTSHTAEGPVHKFLTRVPGSGREGSPGELETESVIIPMRQREVTTHTLCVSSQIGCAMGCGFCETAQMGLMRSLRAEEIVGQWWAATHGLRHAVRNIVFMGMGEPLDNLNEVLRAIGVLTDAKGAGVAMRRVTVSTVGRTDALALLRERVREHGWRQLNLAVSVNAPNDEIRDRIMPINRAMPLAELVGILEGWPLRGTQRICAEYVLIPGVNDEDSHADELAALLRNVACCVNVIPYNPRRDSPWPAPSEADVWRFLRRLESRGQFCKRRRTKGRDTMAACGQLGNERIRRRRVVPLEVSAVG